MSTTNLLRLARTYRQPALLQDIRLFDLLELGGTTTDASRVLSLCQSTVSRRCNALARDLALVPKRRDPAACRYGTSRVLRLLRHACRAHRLGAGVAQLGSDVLHQPLLAGQPWLLPAPQRFRPVGSWLELVREGVVDGALLSGLELELEANGGIDRDGVEILPLGALELGLVVSPDWREPSSGEPPAVLVPHDGVAAGLRQALISQGLNPRSTGNSTQNPGQWLRRLEKTGLAMVLPRLEPAHWWHPLRPLQLPAPLETTVWLAVPAGWREQAVLVEAVERLALHPALSPRGAHGAHGAHGPQNDE